MKPRTNHLAVLAVAAILGLFGLLTWRATQVTRTDKRLCNVIHQLVASSGAAVGHPGSPGYAYYHDHPDELRAVRRQNAADLRRLDCDHLPTG